MSLKDSYKPLYEDLDRASLEKVGAFSAAFMQAKTLGNASEMANLIKQAMDSLAVDPESLDSFLGVINFSSKYGTPLEKRAASKLEAVFTEAVKYEHEKTAAEGQRFGGNIPTQQSWMTPERGFALAGLGIAAAPLAAHLVRKVQTNVKIKNSMRQVLADHPELREDPNLNRYFQAIVDFAPRAAANPLVAGNILKQMSQIGPSVITPTFMKDIQSLDKDYADMRDKQSGSFSEAGRATMEFGKSLKGGR